MSTHFTNLESLNTHIQNEGKGTVLITYRNCEDYAGMVLAIMIVFDAQPTKYELDLQWMSLGLDFYGDTLQESYLYQFESLEKLMEYLEAKYAIQVTDIPIKYKFDYQQFPNPLTDESKKPLYENGWQRFQNDFKKGDFLDTSLKLMYSSIE